MASWITWRDYRGYSVPYPYRYHGEPLNDPRNHGLRWDVWQRIVEWRHGWDKIRIDWIIAHAEQGETGR